MLRRVSRSEARDWANDATKNQVTSAIALYDNAFSDDETVPNRLRNPHRPSSQRAAASGRRSTTTRSVILTPAVPELSQQIPARPASGL